MKLVGVTGGIGMGKSTAGACLQKLGIPVVDTDVIARRLVEPGQPALAEIVKEFSPSVLNTDGTLNRAALGRAVFADAAERGKLEAILHPKIHSLWQNEVAVWRNKGHILGAVIIPLLYETRAESDFHSVICVACSAETQFVRLKQRGLSESEISGRRKAQWPVEEKLARANFVVWTDNPVETHHAQLEKILRRINARPSARAPAVTS